MMTTRKFVIITIFLEVITFLIFFLGKITSIWLYILFAVVWPILGWAIVRKMEAGQKLSEALFSQIASPKSARGQRLIAVLVIVFGLLIWLVFLFIKNKYSIL